MKSAHLFLCILLSPNLYAHKCKLILEITQNEVARTRLGITVPFREHKLLLRSGDTQVEVAVPLEKNHLKPRQLLIKVHSEKGVYNVRLPKLMKDRLLNYLVNGYKGAFDCNCFAQYLNGLRVAEAESTYPGKFKPVLPDKNLSIGTTVAVGKAIGGDTEVSHFAIYLGKGLYLSKLGPLGSLAVSDLSSIMTFYEADSVVYWEPISR